MSTSLFVHQNPLTGIVRVFLTDPWIIGGIDPAATPEASGTLPEMIRFLAASLADFDGRSFCWIDCWSGEDEDFEANVALTEAIRKRLSVLLPTLAIERGSAESGCAYEVWVGTAEAAEAFIG